MGRRAASVIARRRIAQDELLVAFAQIIRERYDAEVYLFGSRARGTDHGESDYDLVAVSESFAGQHRVARAPDRYEMWRAAGGRGISLDLHCYTPEEFHKELLGLGYLGQAMQKGELIKIPVRRAA